MQTAQAQAPNAAYVQWISDRGRARRDRRAASAVLQNRVREAATRVTAAEAALNGFRRRNNLAEPEAQLGSALSLRAGLEVNSRPSWSSWRRSSVSRAGQSVLQPVQSEVGSIRA